MRSSRRRGTRPGVLPMPGTVPGRWLAFLLMVLIVGALGSCAEEPPTDPRQATVQGAPSTAQVGEGAMTTAPSPLPGEPEQCVESVAAPAPGDAAQPLKDVQPSRVVVGVTRLAGAAGCRGPDPAVHREVDLHRLQVLRT